MSHTVKLFERIVNHMLRTIVELGNTHFVSGGGRSTTGSTVDRPLHSVLGNPKVRYDTGFRIAFFT